MAFIRYWAYMQMVRWDLGKPVPVCGILLFWIVVLGVMIDWLL